MKVNRVLEESFHQFHFLIKRIQFLFVLTLLLFTSCNDVKDTPDPPETKTKSKITQTYSEIQVSDSLRPIVDTLVAYNSIDDEGVGYSGSKPITYKTFEKLNQIASDDELIRLTNHFSPAVRGYSFWGLVERNHPAIKEIALNHTQDAAVVDRMSGCTEYPVGLNEFLLATLIDNCRNPDFHVSPEDIAEIEAKMNQ